MAEVEEEYEELEIEDEEDDDYVYEEVELEDEDELEVDLDEDLESAMRSLAGLGAATAPAATASDLEATKPAPGAVTKKPEVIDDFVRNFLLKVGMTKTLEVFETEWYELASTGRLAREEIGPVPDVYMRNKELDDSLKQLRTELEQARAIAAKATGTWDKFRKERDFHRMHHKRVVQEKNKFITDLKRLRKHYSQYEPTIKELRHKYEVAMKEKMLMRLERDKLAGKVEAMEAAKPAVPEEAASEAAPKPAAAKPAAEKKKGVMSKTVRKNPYAQLKFEPMDVSSLKLSKTFKGHLLSVSNLALHPKKPIVATASDDKTWKLWSLPGGDLIMSGEGHKDWVAGVNFHPKGTHLVSASGDCTVKLWDFEKQRCTHTFTDHTQAVWAAAFHDSGDFIASCSLDHSTRLLDVATGKCKQTFRGHVDSVNEVVWQPFTNNICTGSSDKTVSLWDARTGLCVQTFYGHLNSCNHVAFGIRGDAVVSCDADGIVKLWDVRMVAEALSVNVGPHPANKVAMDRSCEVVAVASDDGAIKCFSALDGTPLAELRGHDDAVQAVAFDPFGKYLLSAGSDNTFRMFS